MRIRIDLAYDGAEFSGWAAQPGRRTVQGTLELALGTALRYPPPRVTCAGRTDAGVHARGQVVHVDVAEEVITGSAGRSQEPPVAALLRRLNGILPDDVRVWATSPAAPGFDARFSALWRRYAYRIADRPDSFDPLHRSHVLHRPRPLAIEPMAEAAAALLGEHDFAAFCKRREGATTVRTLLDLGWRRDEDGLVTATVRADAFCHSMVRSLVGAMITVGEGRRPPGWVAELLTAGRRDPAVTVAPAHGLTLEQVGYPDEAGLAEQARVARRRRVLGEPAGADDPEEGGRG